jgi:Flp pilus assembly protein TadG
VRFRRRQESGSIMVIVAVAMLILIAFVGLVVDGGEITSQVRISQNAADGAALAAAWEFAENSQNITSSRQLATIVAGKNGIPTADLTLTFLDANHNATTIPSAVQYVDADVSHAFPTLFLPIINIDTASAKAHAEAQVVNDPYACVVCGIDASAAGALSVSQAVTITGGSVTVDSSSATALTVTGSLTDTAGISVVGGVSGGANISPSATTGVASQPDPLLSIPEPTLSLYTTCPLQPTITSKGPWAPGIYSGIIANGSTDVELDGAAAGACGMQGVFVFTGNISLSGNATLSTVNGAMIFLTCATFPVTYCGGSTSATGACSTAGTPGATLTEGGSSQTHYSPSAGYGGPYAGMAVFADRCNKPASGDVIDYSGSGSTPSSLSGTIYSALGTVHFGGNEDWTLSSRIVGDKVAFDVPLTDAYSSNVNYSPQVQLLLVQ